MLTIGYNEYIINHTTHKNSDKRSIGMKGRSKRSPLLIAGLIFSFFLTFAFITAVLTVYVYEITFGICEKLNLSSEWQGHWTFLMSVLSVLVCVQVLCKLFKEADEEHEKEKLRREALRRAGMLINKENER